MTDDFAASGDFKVVLLKSEPAPPARGTNTSGDAGPGGTAVFYFCIPG